MTAEAIAGLRRQFTRFTESELIGTADALAKQIAGEDPAIDASDPDVCRHLRRIRALVLDEQSRRRVTSVTRNYENSNRQS